MYNLRPYQRERISWAWQAFEDGCRSLLVPMATGTGKTVLFAAMAQRMLARNVPVLVLAHRDELITQAANKLDSQGMHALIEKADQCSHRQARSERWYGNTKEFVTVASVQTLRPKRLAKFATDAFGLIIVDEAHHATASTYRAIFQHFREAKILGVTATPDRSDGECLGKIFERALPEYSILQAIQDGYLAPIVVSRCETGIDLDAISTKGKNDLDPEALEELIKPHANDLANAIYQEIGGNPDPANVKPTVVFTPDVGSAEIIASAIQGLAGGGFRVEAVSYRDPQHRKRAVAGLANGSVRVLVNAMILTEGFDCPPIENVAICRPTKSRALYTQMVGRGTRLSPSTGKQYCNLIDFAWVSQRHDLVKPVHLFATPDLDAEVLERAERIAEESGALAPDIFTQARLQLDSERELERRRLQIEAERKAVRYRRVRYDPFQVQQVLLPPEFPGADRGATPKQIQTLEKMGIPDAAGYSFKRANATLDRLFARRNAGMATYKQVNALCKWGVAVEEAAGLTFDQAHARLDQLTGGG